MERVKGKPDIDQVIYVPGAVMWSVNRKHVTRSGLKQIIEMKEICQYVTIRNVNTVRKLFGLMTEARMQETG